MERTKKLLLFLVFLLFLCGFISLVTKASHIDHLKNRAYMETTLPNIYHSIEGCLALDAILIAIYLALLFAFLKSYRKWERFLLYLIIILVSIRFLLGVLFLAGENERGRKIINTWFYMDEKQKNEMSAEWINFYYTFEVAFIYEVINIIIFNILNCFMFLIWRNQIKEEKQTTQA